MSIAYETFEYKGFTVRIYIDECVDEPTWVWESIDFILCNNDSNYVFGEKGYNIDSYTPWGEGEWDLSGETDAEVVAEERERWEDDHDPGYLCYPLHVGEAHGPGTTTFDHSTFDRSNAFLLVPVATNLSEQLADERDIDKLVEQVLETYNQWAQGDVFGFVIEDSDGVEIDSCWGFYGFENCKESAEWACDPLADKVQEYRFRVAFTNGTREYARFRFPLSVGEEKARDEVEALLRAKRDDIESVTCVNEPDSIAC